jgi:acyl carrier protein
MAADDVLAHGIERRLRLLTAGQLGVSTEELHADVALIEDLGADSLDLLELSLVLEDEFGASISADTLAGVRTYGELVRAVLSRVRDDTAVVPAMAAVVATRLVGPGERPIIERKGGLSASLVQLLGEQALTAGSGARMEVVVRHGADAATIAEVAGRLGWLARWGIEVIVGPEGWGRPEARPPRGFRVLSE